VFVWHVEQKIEGGWHEEIVCRITLNDQLLLHNLNLTLDQWINLDEVYRVLQVLATDDEGSVNQQIILN
jgi:hypothetical protein